MGLLLKHMFQTPYFRIVCVEDEETVELCGALKVSNLQRFFYVKFGYTGEVTNFGLFQVYKAWIYCLAFAACYDENICRHTKSWKKILFSSDHFSSKPDIRIYLPVKCQVNVELNVWYCNGIPTSECSHIPVHVAPSTGTSITCTCTFCSSALNVCSVVTFTLGWSLHYPWSCFSFRLPVDVFFCWKKNIGKPFCACFQFNFFKVAPCTECYPLWQLLMLFPSSEHCSYRGGLCQWPGPRWKHPGCCHPTWLDGNYQILQDFISKYTSQGACWLQSISHIS